MIKIVGIEAHNFLTFLELPYTGIEDLGLVFVRGKNLDDLNADSNDSGKTNLFNVISWVLYEKLAKAGNRIIGDEVINVQAGAECWARVTLDINGDKYFVQRRRNCRGIKNGAEISGALVAQGRRSATNEEIEKLLGMTYQMFLSSVFWAQGTATRRLTQLTDAEYKALFDELVGTEDFEVKYKKFTRKIAELGSMLHAMDVEIGQLRGMAVATKDAIDSAKAKYPKINVAEIVKENQKCERAWTRRIELENEVAKLEREEVSARSNMAIQRRTAEGIAQNLEKAKQSIAANKCALCGQELKNDKAQDHVAKELARQRQALSEMKPEYTNVQKRVKALQTEIGKMKMARDLAIAKHANLESDVYEMLPEELRQRDIPSAIALLEADRKKGSAADLRVKLKEINADIVKADDKKAALNVLASKYEALRRAYGPTGMKSMRLAELTPLLNDKAAEYSDRLSGGTLQVNFSTTSELKSGELREKYCVDVKKDQDVNFQLSGGGMTRKADLIAAFALDEVREIMTGKQVMMKIYDEATDGLDAAGEASVVDLLRQDISGTVFFVSHKSLVGENMFDRVWEVTRENRISVLNIVK